MALSWRAALPGRWPGHRFAAGIRVELYGKAGCHLCEVAWQELLRLQQRWGFELSEVDLATRPDLQAQYTTRIPLVWVEGMLACEHRVEAPVLRRKLQHAVATRRKS